MNGKVKVEDLLPETRKKLGLETKIVPDRTIALGKVFTALQALTTRDAYWVLRTASLYVPGYKRTLTRARHIPKPHPKEVSK